MKNFLPLILTLFLASCGSTVENTSEESSDNAPTYAVDFKEFSEREADCASEQCTEVKIVLPFLKGGDTVITAEVNTDIEDQYRQLIRSRLPEPRSTGSWESLAASFIEGYELFKMEFPDDPTSWYLYLEGRESSIVGDTVFTVMVNDSEFMGGAHGNSATLIQSYSLKDGMPIDFVERYGVHLKEVAERKFRAHHSISINEPLNDAGFIFPEEGFILPDNIGYSSKGLILIYNPYEVAPYSTGTTELIIPISDLEARSEAS
ncbi:DUF3298 domain-containing protein [Cryomorphaceae bacterium 1068]|nr:DUF3298 domain-containing protein [Cryomorphaceae bacterium 1068]